MSDEIEVTPQAKQAAMLAVLAAGDPSNTKRWKRKVQEVLPVYAALAREDYGYWGKEAQGIIDAQVFVGTFKSMRLEESSKRLIVTMESPKADDGVEEIRTERTDTPPGWVMKERLEHLEPGTEIAAFKKVESIGQNKKVRVLVHFEPLRSSKSTGNDGAPPSRSSQPVPPPAEGQRSASPSREPDGEYIPSSPSGSEQLSAEAQAVQDALVPLTARQRVAVKNACVGAGVENWTDPGPESIDRVLLIIKEVAS